MQRRRNMGVLVAVAVAIAAALASEPARRSPQAQSPIHVTLALEPDGVALHVAQGRFVFTFEI